MLKRLKMPKTDEDKSRYKDRDELEKLKATADKALNDPINHPPHYTDGKIEVADFIADKNLNFFRGNVVKYMCRAGKKAGEDELRDLQKAVWYLDREVERVQEEG